MFVTGRSPGIHLVNLKSSLAGNSARSTTDTTFAVRTSCSLPLFSSCVALLRVSLKHQLLLSTNNDRVFYVALVLVLSLISGEPPTLCTLQWLVPLVTVEVCSSVAFPYYFLQLDASRRKSDSPKQAAMQKDVETVSNVMHDIT